MNEIISELEKLPMATANKLLAMIEKYGEDQRKNGWHAGWNKAIDTAGYGTPPEPSVRNEVRNTPIVNNQIGQL